MSGETTTEVSGSKVTVRCPFCLTLNQIDLSRAPDRPRCGECGKPILLDRPIKISGEDFDRTVLGSEAPVIVDFFAEWCGPCKWVAPILDRLAQEKVGELLVVKVDTDQAPRVASRYGIRGVPTVILFEKGKEVERSVGVEPERLARMAGTAT